MINEKDIRFKIGSIFTNLIKSKDFIEFTKSLITIKKERYYGGILKDHNIRKDSLLVYCESIGLEMGWKEAVDKCLNLIDTDYIAGVNILQANNHHKNEDEWLIYLNRYLKIYNLSPIYLIEGKGDLFFRLNSKIEEKNNSDCLVSIIICAFNAEKTLRKSVESILNQTWANIEVIIVDDASVDTTWEIVKDIIKKDSRVKAIKNKKNVGPYVSKNIALKIAQGVYFTGHDADDWSHPERIERDMNVIESSYGYVKAVTSNYIKMDENGVFCKFRSISSNSDGISRLAPISLLVETNWFKSYIGSWDAVRFSADSEVINRIKILLGDRYYKHNNVGMICLNLSTSLTNNSIHGVSNKNGLSITRTKYMSSYKKWHLRSKNLYVNFPEEKRCFEAPQEMLVNIDDIQYNLNNLKIVTSKEI